VRALRTTGRLERVDSGIVAIHRAAADNVDAAERARDWGDGSPYVVAMALRVYLAADAMLRDRTGELGPTDDDELWRELSAPLGDPSTL
jgi:hypothetical protein